MEKKVSQPGTMLWTMAHTAMAIRQLHTFTCITLPSRS